MVWFGCWCDLPGFFLISHPQQHPAQQPATGLLQDFTNTHCNFSEDVKRIVLRDFFVTLLIFIKHLTLGNWFTL
jgi:hypothetical protein